MAPRHAVAGLTSQDAQIVRAAYHMMELTVGSYCPVKFRFAADRVANTRNRLGLFGTIGFSKTLDNVFATIILLTFMQASNWQVWRRANIVHC